jgi:hypothetical protein
MVGSLQGGVGLNNSMAYWRTRRGSNLQAAGYRRDKPECGQTPDVVEAKVLQFNRAQGDSLKGGLLLRTELRA